MREFFTADKSHLFLFRSYEEAVRQSAHVLSYATLKEFYELHRKGAIVEIWEASGWPAIGKTRSGYRMGYITEITYNPTEKNYIEFAFESGLGEKTGDILVTREQIDQLEKGFN